MSTRILIPFDGSEQARAALTSAHEGFPEAELLLLHVVEPFANHTEAAGFGYDRYENEIENARLELEAVAEETSERERIQTDVVYGRPVHAILQYLEDSHVDHVVMGSKGRDAAARLLLGSVAETVVRRAPVPVTVIRSEQMVTPPEEILVPFDASEQSTTALRFALEKFPDATVTVVYVLYPDTDIKSGDSAYRNSFPELEDWAEHRNEHARKILDRATEVAESLEREIETDCIDGDPATAVVAYAETNDVDHIVIGSTGRDGLGRLLLGSVAETVVRRAPVSVTVPR